MLTNKSNCILYKWGYIYIDFPLKSPVITNSHGHKLLHDSSLPFRPQLVDTLVTSFSFDVLPWDSQDEICLLDLLARCDRDL